MVYIIYIFIYTADSVNNCSQPLLKFLQLIIENIYLIRLLCIYIQCITNHVFVADINVKHTTRL